MMKVLRLGNSLSKVVLNINNISLRNYRSKAAVNHSNDWIIPDTKITKLTSGFRIASEDSKLPTATVGVWVNAGSRFENDKNNGVAHFSEHMAFKGTNKRNQTELELEVENNGILLNAYTSREQTVYYAKCPSTHIEQAIEILSDILLNSTYRQNEIEIERDVIMREYFEIENTVKEVLFDRLHEQAYKNTPLARTILGPRENIKSISKNDLIRYVHDYYQGPRMVLAAAGGVNHDQLVEWAEKYFAQVNRFNPKKVVYEPGIFKECHLVIKDERMPIVHGAFCVEGVSWTNPDNLALMIIHMLIGTFNCTQASGINAPSRLASRLTPRNTVENFMAFSTNYVDTGLTGVYFEMGKEDGKMLCDAIIDEWRSLTVFDDENALENTKIALLANTAMTLDGTTPICEDIGRQILCYGRRIPLPEIEARINAVTVETIRKVARKYFFGKPYAFTIIGPSNNWPSKNYIKKRLDN
ncbi:Cytochrome b-c1 complex subunit 1, mitochondrial [Strongyloides ratti]|uniref:Cytochrome b-c1 complex subunit 1, mitochondrial n=1 Tax=Strongyloides ratti TaxID=34506 RepID=A0A090MX66_STRRB|nr:Cytochrome b-c1 complex subunit 1, mitochondrial [Strongyloides ratti]CEF64899.1 Cytochrome b-c1 complex subunit 1, mitochondrial [Strongyloides ratti]